MRQGDDEGQQHARKFAAGCDAGERTRRFAGVSREEKIDAFGATRADLGQRLEIDFETSRTKRDLAELSAHPLAQGSRRLCAARRSTPPAARSSSFARRLHLGSPLRENAIAIFVFVDDAPGALRMDEYSFERVAVLTLQTFQSLEPGVDRFEFRRIVLGRFQRARHVGGKIAGFALKRRHAFGHFAQIAGKLRDRR